MCKTWTLKIPPNIFDFQTEPESETWVYKKDVTGTTNSNNIYFHIVQ